MRNSIDEFSDRQLARETLKEGYRRERGVSRGIHSEDNVRLMMSQKEKLVRARHSHVRPDGTEIEARHGLGETCA